MHDDLITQLRDLAATYRRQSLEYLTKSDKSLSDDLDADARVLSQAADALEWNDELDRYRERNGLYVRHGFGEHAEGVGAVLPEDGAVADAG